jgi:hypothetical protein
MQYLAELALLVLLVEKIRKKHLLNTFAAHWEFTGFLPQSKLDYSFLIIWYDI